MRGVFLRMRLFERWVVVSVEYQSVALLRGVRLVYV